MKIAQLGEWKLIEWILNSITKHENLMLPYGDDASAFRVSGAGDLVVINTDMLVGSTDIPPGMNYWQVGRKAVVMCISDLAAKGAKPAFLMFSLGLKRDMRMNEFQELIRGLNNGAREYDSYIIGGDLNEACDLIISGTAIGFSKKIISRKGARAGDFLAVTGFFGDTAAGLKILLHELKVEEHLKKKLVNAVYMPRAHVKEGIALANSGAVTSAIDSSDGLAISLHELVKQNNIGFKIYKLPISKAAREFSVLTGIDPIELVFYGGEEYNLVITIKRDMLNKAIEAVSNVGGKLIVIGEVVEEKKVIYVERGREVKIENRGWEHFT